MKKKKEVVRKVKQKLACYVVPQKDGSFFLSHTNNGGFPASIMSEDPANIYEAVLTIYENPVREFFANQ